MVITVWVHRVDTARFPAVPEGWRWCVGAGSDPTDPRLWANAGWAPTATEAHEIGDQCAATAVNLLELAGVPAERCAEVLEYDPCPDDAMHVAMPGSLTLGEL